MKSKNIFLLTALAVADASAPVTNAPVCANAAGRCTEQCSLYLAPSATSGWTVFAGQIFDKGDTVGAPDLILPIVDANKNEYSPWHDIVWDDDLPVVAEQAPQYLHQLDYFWAGLGALASCTQHPTLSVQSDDQELFFAATESIRVGEELSMDCRTPPESTRLHGAVPPTLEWLQKEAICLDTLTVQQSNSKKGRGAFAKNSVKAGHVVAVSPLLHFDRSQTEILQQEYMGEDTEGMLLRDHGILYSSKVVGQQELLNYCYSDPKSNVMLLPLAPTVNFIGHSSKQANVEMRWSNIVDSTDLRETLPVMELFEEPAGNLVVEFVALSDIQAGDEILIDYGSDWEQAVSNNGDDEPFYHERGVPEGFYPANWIKFDPETHVHDFIANPLKSGYMAPVRWASTAEAVTPWAFRMGLDSKIRTVLMDYCNKMGITTMLKHVTVEGNGLKPGTNKHFDLEGDDWFLQRPEAHWKSNLHWLSPGAGPAHEHYLQALSVAGFDEILQSIGEYLNMDGLVAFHVTFIAVSHSTKGYLHYDMDGTGRKMYNVIIPLILANETNPELDIQDLHPDLADSEQDFQVGRYQYEYDVAGMMGDGAVHGTSAVDYRMNKEMRMAATVYITDVNEGNVDSISSQYTQAYPPSDRDLLLSWAGRHWKKDDPSVKLPQPEPDHILLRDVADEKTS